MSGCPQQKIELNPSDKDGDEIKCRWSTKTESKDGFHAGGNFASLTLDEENCIVWYDGTKEKVQFPNQIMKYKISLKLVSTIL